MNNPELKYYNIVLEDIEQRGKDAIGFVLRDRIRIVLNFIEVIAFVLIAVKVFN